MEKGLERDENAKSRVVKWRHMKAKALSSSSSKIYIGIDYHKRYSVFHVLDGAGNDLAKGRIDHNCPEDFARLVKRWPCCAVVFEPP